MWTNNCTEGVMELLGLMLKALASYATADGNKDCDSGQAQATRPKRKIFGMRIWMKGPREGVLK